MKVSEIFQAVQGEGATIGQNSIFLRLSGCTLNCNFCDSEYHKKGEEKTIEEIKNEIEKFPTKNLVITGGEPLLQQEEIEQLLLQLPNYFVTIETNGTISPNPSLIYQGVLFACSPKLANSGNNLEKRMNYDALRTINNASSIFKFVISDKKDLEEIKFLCEQIEIVKEKVYLMKEGKTKDEQTDVENIINICLEEGFNFSPRIHIMVYGERRGV